MAYPTLSVEVAFGDAWNDATPTWVDVTTSVRHDPPIRISRATSRISRPRPGTLTLTLDNTDRTFDPDYASGAYANDLVPMVPIRLRATHNAVTYELFRGFVAEWNVGTEDFKDSTTTVVAVDGLSVLELLRVESPFALNLAGTVPKAWYRFSESAGSTMVLDRSTHGHHGTNTGVTLGATGSVIGESDRAGDFGSGDYVALPNESGISSGSMTVLAWFNTENADPAGNYSHLWMQGQLIAGAVDISQGWITLRVKFGGHLQMLVTPLGSSTTVTLEPADDVVDTSWHLATGVIDGTNLLLYIDGTVKDTDTWAGGSFNPLQIRMGYAGESGTTGHYDGLLSEVAVYDYALTAAEIAAIYDTLTTPWTGQLTSARITAVLNAVGWPTALRDLDTGLTTMGMITETGTALSLVYQAVDSENGAAWMTGAGKLWFGNRNWRNTSSYAATFSNDGSDTGYQALAWHRDQNTLRTVAQVTDLNAAVTEYIGANEASYGPRVISRTTYTESVTEPYDYATWLYGEFGTPKTDANLRLTAGAGSATGTWAEILSRELGDLVNVEVKPVGGTTQNDWDMFVESIDHTFGVDNWTVNLGMTNADTQRGFVLDNAVIGKLDGVGRLGW